jgi:hypothetical protein
MIEETLSCMQGFFSSSMSAMEAKQTGGKVAEGSCNGW